MHLITAMLAHAGGWDEILLFGAPVAVVLVAIGWAERRARARRDQPGGSSDADAQEAGEPAE